MVDLIQYNCRKLSEVRLCGSFTIIEAVGEERYAKFLCSFRSQLIHAEIEELSIEKLNQVVRACPNLLISFFSVHCERGEGWERGSLFGPMIKNLSLSAYMFLEEKCGALEKRTNLESIFIHGNIADEEEGIGDGFDLTFFSRYRYLLLFFMARPNSMPQNGILIFYRRLSRICVI